MRISKKCLYQTINPGKATFNVWPALVITNDNIEKTITIAFKWLFMHAGVQLSEQTKPNVQHPKQHTCTIIPFTQRK